MKQKHLLWLAGALVLALLAATLAGVFEDDVSTIQVPEVEIDSGDVTAISIQSPRGSFSLERRASEWTLTKPVGARADSGIVSRFLSDLDELELTSVVTRNPERYARFGVDSTGTVVTLTSGEGKQAFVIGDRSPDNASNYIRVDDDERVFLSRKAVNVPEEVDRWRDRTLLSP